MTKKTLDVKTLAKYLGPSFVHPIEYWAQMWRILDPESGKYQVIKCPKEDHCILYYTDREGFEHREGLFTIDQLPVKYRQEKVSSEAAKSITSNTTLTFENVVSLYGEPFVDPDIPFVYKWERGNYELTMVGKIFSFVQKGQDDRSTLTLFGQLPSDFRHALNTQGNKEGLKQIPLDTVNPDEVLKKTEASEKAKQFESRANPQVEYSEDTNRIPTVSDGDFDLSKALEGLGVETRALPEDDEFPDDNDKFVSSRTEDAKLIPESTDRKKMIVEVKSEEVFDEPKPYPDKKLSELEGEALAERRSWVGRKGAFTAKMKKKNK